MKNLLLTLCSDLRLFNLDFRLANCNRQTLIDVTFIEAVQDSLLKGVTHPI